MYIRLFLVLGMILLGNIQLYAQETMTLTLSEAEDFAIKNNPRLKAAMLNATASTQVPDEYGAAYLPTLEANATGVVADEGSRLAAGGLNNPVLYDRFATGFSLSQLVTDFGRTGDLVNMARLRADAQNQAAEQARADIILMTAQAYFSVLRGQVVLKVAQETVTARQLLADQTAAMARSNLKSKLDVSFANVNLDDARLLLAQAENSLKTAQAQLAALLGVSGGTAFSLYEEPVPDLLTGTLDDLIQKALQSRPELRQLRLEQDAAEKFALAEHALYYPNIKVMGAAGLVPAGAKQVKDHYGAIGININIPVFSGGLFKSRENEAGLRAEAAKQNVSDSEARIARDVRLAYLNAKISYDRIGLTEKMLNQAQTALDLAHSRYNLGLSSIIELSQAQLNLTSAQIAYAGAKYDYQIQRINFDYQIGVLK